MFVLDSNVVSEFRKAPSGRADPGVVRWAREIDASAMYLSVLTVFEIELGVARMERRDPVQASILRHWFEGQIMIAFADRLLPVDAAVARRAATLHVPDPKPDRDAFIAATALVHAMTVVTRNAADFTPTGVPVLNPWTH